MTRCVRAGCGGETTALASFDRENLVVRLRNVDTDSAFTIGLCETHVGRLTVPMGWALADERSEAAESGSSLPTPRGEPTDTSDESATPRRRPSSPEGGLLNRAFQGPDSSSQTKRRQSWLEGNDDERPSSSGEAAGEPDPGENDPPAESASASAVPIEVPGAVSPPVFTPDSKADSRLTRLRSGQQGSQPSMGFPSAGYGGPHLGQTRGFLPPQ